MRAPIARAALAIVAAVWTSAAHAQETGTPPPPSEGYPAPADAPAAPPPVTAPVPPPPPQPITRPAPAPEMIEPESENDLDPSKRSVGIGYAGVSQVPVGGPVGVLTAPAIGVRGWVSPKTAIDFALGFAWADGSTEVGNLTTDLNAAWGLVVQGGVPLALANHRHVSFQVIPFATFAYGRTKGPSGPLMPATTFNGTRFDLGVRAGLEIFWGFLGLPQLSLSGTVGAAFELRTLTEDNGMAFGKMSTTTYGITTTVQNNPWDIFTGNVAARYYF